jgi:hypothetical protein
MVDQIEDVSDSDLPVAIRIAISYQQRSAGEQIID